MKKILSRKEFINEAKSDYKVYHKRYSEVIDEIENYATSLGYELDQQEYGTAYVDAFFKPDSGETKSDTITLYKDGKKQRKALQVQIHGENNKFELNIYIN